MIRIILELIGILLLGVSDHVIARNTVEDNDFVGIGVLGWCTANNDNPFTNCFVEPPITDPRANNNLIAQNKVSGNGSAAPPIPIDYLAADLTYFQLEGLFGFGNGFGNCFEKNKPAGFSFVSSEPSGQLPTDGCRPGGPKK